MTSPIWKQPRSVWAVAFASVIAFMGIGLVDPILPAITHDLDATPAQAMLLFTSYLVVTGVAMFFTSALSSRIGAKRTLLIGLVLVVAFAALAGSSETVEAIIGFRAGWGLGNALFISTALASIVGAAAGSANNAIILYEASLGLGIATGPLLGGLLGSISWRGPFFGTAALMALGFILLLVLLPRERQRPEPIKVSATFRALGRPALLSLAVVALFYNFGFFTLLAYTPFPLEAAAPAAGIEDFGASQLGLIFFAWGIGLALTSVFLAPVLTARFGRRKVLAAMLVLLAVDLAVMAELVNSLAVLVVGIVAGGLLLGVMNTVLTESVMEATDLPRAVASSTYSGVRFLGGAVAPAIGGIIAAQFGAWVPLGLGALAFLASFAVLLACRRTLAVIDSEHPESSAFAPRPATA